MTGVYLRYLSVLADTHIARKLGPGCAEAIRLRAVGLYERFAAAETPASLERELLAFDAELKAAGINPGTSADLTVATVFAHRLAQAAPRIREPGACRPGKMLCIHVRSDFVPGFLGGRDGVRLIGCLSVRRS